jgi:chorismate-pyruvate lyase
MTFLLEACAGEPIGAVKLHQELDAANPTDQSVLALADAAPILRRNALLRGVRSGRVFVYAAAVVAIGRIDEWLGDALTTTDAPIGHLLADSRTETFRELLRRGTSRAGEAGRYLELSADAEVLFRTYRIHSGGEPIMLITERSHLSSSRGSAIVGQSERSLGDTRCRLPSHPEAATRKPCRRSVGPMVRIAV